jgi:polysaccharide biosynthesis protein PslH
MSRLPRGLRILAVCGRPPLPAVDGDTFANLGLLTALTWRSTVTLLTVAHVNSSMSSHPELDALVEGRLVLLDAGMPPRYSTWAAILRFLRGARTGMPSRYLSRMQTDFPVVLTSLSKSNDVVVFLDNYFAHYVHYSMAPTILHLHNVDGWSADANRPEAWIRRRLHAHSVRQVRTIEGRAVRAADAVTVTSENECERLARLYNVASVVVPSAVPIPITLKQTSRKRIVIWLGSHSYNPNIEGLRRFLEESWPKIAAETNAEFWIAGDRPPPDIVGRDGIQGVKVLGFVEDVVGLMAEVAVGVVPLWEGAGVKLKTIMMMAHMVPVVTTAVGAEGIPLAEPKPVVVAEEPVDMTRAVVQLLEDDRMAATLAARGREVAVAGFSREVVGDLMEGVISTLLMRSGVSIAEPPGMGQS